ncbi:MAG: hypothetical protein FWG80_00385 [Alphaproteobacteria bacterium]|nr:hypothetical protein [Alphaproteobacteria bacterium]
MSKLKEFFTNLRQQLPVHVQWLLLFAAFLVVVILLLLVLSSPKKTQRTTTAVKIGIVLDTTEIEWRDVTVGDTRTQRIEVSATTDVKIADVKIAGLEDPDSHGLTQRSTCTNMGVISPKVPCNITLEFKPDVPLKDTGAEIQIIYHSATQPASMSEMEKLPVLLSAKESKNENIPARQPETLTNIENTEPFSITEPEPTFIFEEIDPVFDSLEPDLTFEEDLPFEPEYEQEFEPEFEPEPLPVPEPRPQAPVSNDVIIDATPAAELCYEFAFAGYNLSGRHSGWIRADGGRYMYHPFSDRDCNNPTGEYNPDTGLIYDIKNKSKTIGSDSERIGARSVTANLALPNLSSARSGRTINRAQQSSAPTPAAGEATRIEMREQRTVSSLLPSSIGAEATVSSVPHDRTFVLRQFKPIPATIVSEIRADPKRMSHLPVTATVDRHVYSDNGRTIIVPAGTMMLGFMTGELPGPYRSIGRMDIKWYRFVRPDGVEFNFAGDQEPFSADSQGRAGVPGYGTTDYIESMLMPMITAVVPAAVNLIAPISDRFVNQIDLDNNTVTQSGQVRSSELAKQEIISTWNKVVQKLTMDMLENTTPPFSIAAGTRITVFSPTDLVVTCGEEGIENKKCAIHAPSEFYRPYVNPSNQLKMSNNPEEWMGQVRAFTTSMQGVCETDNNGNNTGEVALDAAQLQAKGLDYRAAEFWCKSNMYQGRTQAAYNTYWQDLSNRGGITTQSGQILAPSSQEYNQQILGLQYNDAGTMLKNPFEKPPPPPPAVSMGISCDDGSPPDHEGCCASMGEVFDPSVTSPDSPTGSCCPASGDGDCFPPIL